MQTLANRPGKCPVGVCGINVVTFPTSVHPPQHPSILSASSAPCLSILLCLHHLSPLLFFNSHKQACVLFAWRLGSAFDPSFITEIISVLVSPPAVIPSSCVLFAKLPRALPVPWHLHSYAVCIPSRLRSMGLLPGPTTYHAVDRDAEDLGVQLGELLVAVAEGSDLCTHTPPGSTSALLSPCLFPT